MRYKKLIIIFFFIVLLVALPRLIGIENYINFQAIKMRRGYLFAFTRKHYWLSVFVYIFSYIFVAALSLPIAVPLTLLGGFVFDVFPTVLYTNIGATLGAVITFLIARYFLGFTIQKVYSRKLIAFNKNINLYGANYLLLARFIVLIPFFLINILAALTNIPLRTFIWTTSIGIIPGSCIYAYAGKNIIAINSPEEIFSLKIILLFALLILFGLGSLFLKKINLFKNKRVKHE